VRLTFAVDVARGGWAVTYQLVLRPGRATCRMSIAHVRRVFLRPNSRHYAITDHRQMQLQARTSAMRLLLLLLQGVNHASTKFPSVLTVT